MGCLHCCYNYTLHRCGWDVYTVVIIIRCIGLGGMSTLNCCHIRCIGVCGLFTLNCCYTLSTGREVGLVGGGLSILNCCYMLCSCLGAIYIEMLLYAA